MLTIFFFFRDGTSKLWHVASGKVIDDLVKFNPTTLINCCSISSPKNINLGKRNVPTCKYHVLLLYNLWFIFNVMEAIQCMLNKLVIYVHFKSYNPIIYTKHSQ